MSLAKVASPLPDFDGEASFVKSYGAEGPRRFVATTLDGAVDTFIDLPQETSALR